MSNKTKLDTLLVSIDFTRGEDVDILLVGRKAPTLQPVIVNAFQGEEARKIYEMLVTAKGSKEEERDGSNEKNENV